MVSLAFADGFFVLSAGQVDYRSNDPQLGGKWWSITVSQNGAGNYIVGTFTSDQLTDSTDAVKAQYPLTLTASISNEKVTWDIQKQSGQYVADLEVERQDCGFPYLCDWDNRGKNCANKHASDSNYLKYLWVKRTGLTAYCVWWTNARPHGEISPYSQNSFTSTLSGTVSGQTVTGTVSNTGTTSVWLGDKIQATWTGSLVSGFNVYFPSDKVFTWIPGSGWLVTGRTEWSNYYTQYQSSFENCMAAEGAKTYEQCISDYETAKNGALTTKTITIQDASSPTISGTVDLGKFAVSLSKPVTFPVLNLKINALWIGVVQLVGKPQINGFGSQSEFRTGDTLNEQVIVQNIGAYTGTFDVYATCTSPLSSADRERVTLTAGQQGSVYIAITGSTTRDTTASCIFTAVDVNQPSNIATKSKTYTIKTIIVCTAGATNCNGNQVQQCEADGSRFTTIRNCDYGCEVVGTTAQCIVPSTCIKASDCDDKNSCTTDTCETNLIGQKSCKNEKIPGCGGFPDWIFYVIGAVVIIAISMVLVFTKPKTKRRR